MPLIDKPENALLVVEKTGNYLPPGIPPEQAFSDADHQKAMANTHDALRLLFEEVLKGTTPATGPELSAAVAAYIAGLDGQLSAMMDAVLHDPDFQELEATWRGLHQLVMNTVTSTTLKLKVLNVTKDELHTDVTTAVETDQSVLFKKVYEEEYGTLGGQPYSCLLGAYEWSHLPEDLATLRGIAAVAASAHAPFLSAASPYLLNGQDWSGLMNPRDLAGLFESADYINWNSFRDEEDSRYVALCLPRVVMRLPYGETWQKVPEFRYEESTSIGAENRFLWGNAAWFLAMRVTDAFFNFGWTAAIRGVEGGGKVSNLPIYLFPEDPEKADDPGTIRVPVVPTEIAITDRREKELSDLGLISLCYCKGTNYATFFSGATLHRPKVYNKDAANANARLSSTLPYLLNASRFAHYIKVMMRNKIGSFMTAKNVADYLNTWIVDYVLLDDNAQQTIKAQYPLREARIDVIEVPGKPGAYTATVFLRPHFQLEELTASLRLVAELPPPAAA